MSKKVNAIKAIDAINKQIAKTGGDPECCTILAIADNNDGTPPKLLYNGDANKICYLLHMAMKSCEPLEKIVKEVARMYDEIERVVAKDEVNKHMMS